MPNSTSTLNWVGQDNNQHLGTNAFSDTQGRYQLLVVDLVDPSNPTPAAKILDLQTLSSYFIPRSGTVTDISGTYSNGSNGPTLSFGQGTNGSINISKLSVATTTVMNGELTLNSTATITSTGSTKNVKIWGNSSGAGMEINQGIFNLISLLAGTSSIRLKINSYSSTTAPSTHANSNINTVVDLGSSYGTKTGGYLNLGANYYRQNQSTNGRMVSEYRFNRLKVAHAFNGDTTSADHSDSYAFIGYHLDDVGSLYPYNTSSLTEPSANLIAPNSLGNYNTEGANSAFSIIDGASGLIHYDQVVPFTNSTFGGIPATNATWGVGTSRYKDPYPSDDRLKTRVADSSYTLEQICSIPVFEYFFNDDSSRKIMIGSSAQSIEKVEPLLVDNLEGSEYKGVHYDKLSLLAIEGIKRLTEKCNELEAELRALKENR